MALFRSYRRAAIGKRPGFGLFTRILVVLIVLGALALTAVVFFRVKTVEVTGLQHYTPDQLIDASGVKIDSSLLLTKRGATEDKLMADFPYLESVSVSIKLPDKVLIEATECTPVAYIDDGGRRWVIDSRGKLLDCLPTTETAAGFAVKGISLKEPEVNTYFTSIDDDIITKESYDSVIKAARDYDFFADIDYVDMTTIADIRFELEGRFLVRLGLVDGLDYKMQTLTEMLKDLNERKSNIRGTIDLSDCVETRCGRFTEDLG